MLNFFYYTPVGIYFPEGGAIIDRNDQRTRRDDEAQRINAELEAPSPTQMKNIKYRAI